MQQQINVESQVALEECHKLVCLELGLQEVLDRHKSTGARDLDVAAAALEGENADLVARDGQIDLSPIAFRHARPRYEDTFVEKSSSAVFVRAELGDSPASLELALVIVLFGEWKEKPFFPG
jgi:hypothetical protein